MRDNQLIQIFFPIIQNGLIADGFVGVNVIAANQPTQQGTPLVPTVTFYKIGDHRYGFLRRYDTWDSINGVMIHTEEQAYETTFQISALALQNPGTPDQYTASDIVNEVAAIMQSDNTLNILYNNGIAILRITEVSNGYFTDDMDNFEASPSFDFTLTHTQTRVSTGNAIDHVEYDIFRV
jgi:hypothetical protein